MEISVARATAWVIGHTTKEEWNKLVDDAKLDDRYWLPELSNQVLGGMDLSGRNLRGAMMCGATLDRVDFSGADLTGANLYGASIYNTQFELADLTGVDIAACDSVSSAFLDNAIGYTKPLPDITEQLAKQALYEQINDPHSHVNEGLQALLDSGLQAEWNGTKLTFFMSQQMERYRDDCRDGDCNCEVYHSCGGSCSCCSCYTGDCDCEPEHDGETYPTGEAYLATVIGELYFEWNSVVGMIGNISMSSQSLHPHISTAGSVCWGDAEMPRTMRAADYMLMVIGWIGQHNVESEYREITDLPNLINH